MEEKNTESYVEFTLFDGKTLKIKTNQDRQDQDNGISLDGDGYFRASTLDDNDEQVTELGHLFAPTLAIAIDQCINVHGMHNK